jgi:hypothetical protein
MPFRNYISGRVDFLVFPQFSRPGLSTYLALF